MPKPTTEELDALQFGKVVHRRPRRREDDDGLIIHLLACADRDGQDSSTAHLLRCAAERLQQLNGKRRWLGFLRACIA